MSGGPWCFFVRTPSAEATKGFVRLSTDQKNVFQWYVVDKYINLKFERCGAEMPLSEVVPALTEEDDLCTWCRKMESNED